MKNLTDKQFANVLGSIGFVLIVISLIWFGIVFAQYGTNFNHDPEIALCALGTFTVLGAIGIGKGVQI